MISLQHVMNHISYVISYMISFFYVISYMIFCCCLAAADPTPAQRADANDGGHERDADLDRSMDSDEDRDYAC